MYLSIDKSDGLSVTKNFMPLNSTAAGSGFAILETMSISSKVA
jgi:hypothetical protein